MFKQIFEDAAEVATQIEEQLKFYGEIGISDLGNSGSAQQTAPGAVSDVQSFASITSPLRAPTGTKSTTETNTFADVPPAIPPGESQPGQAALFEDLGLASEAPSWRATKAPLSVLEARDSSLESIREDIGDCHRCKLHEHRNTIVFGEGNPNAELVFIGEGPGAEEDATGRPFVGRAGQLLDKIIAAIGLKREDVYIANIVKCRPPGNRTPERDEVATCEGFLFRQVAFIKPKVIVALGSPAFQCLLRTREPISRVRGEWRDFHGIKLMPTFHPAFLLRSPDKKREVWEDMKKVRDYLNSGE